MVLGPIEILQLEMLFRKQTEIAQGLQSPGCYNMLLHLWVCAVFCTFFRPFNAENTFGKNEALQVRTDGT